MPSRAPASPQEIQTETTVAEALKRSARPLALVSVLLGAATFAVLATVAPNYVSAFPEKVQLSVLMAVAGLMFGSALVVVVTLFRRGPAQERSTPPVAQPKRAEPALLKEEPLLSEMPDAGAVHSAEQADASIAQHAFQDSSNVTATQDGAPASPAYVEINSLAARLKARRPSGGGHRALITGVSEAVDTFEAARDLAEALADSGAQTILIDWSPSGKGFAHAKGLDTRTGWNALMRGEARFDDMIQRLPGTRAHAIASGNALRDGGANLDVDVLNLALDALDEVYDHIVVTASHDEARALFECIEGRFDAGIAVVTDGEVDTGENGASAFLGFEVADIDILRFRHAEKAASASPIAQRIARATRAREPAAQRA